MKTTRSNNISLFVTVLSACLGLLAIGTPAQVFAQQAVRAAESSAPVGEDRNYSDENSTEVQELLKSKPFLSSFREFISEVKSLIADKWISGSDVPRTVSSTLLVIDGRLDVQSTTFVGRRPSRQALEGYFGITAFAMAQDIVENDFNADSTFYRFNSLRQEDVARFDFTFNLDASGLLITIAHDQASDEQALRLKETYNSYFSHGANNATDELAPSFYHNTEASIETDLVFKVTKILIVTRLPRAGLDKLLAEQPAAI